MLAGLTVGIPTEELGPTPYTTGSRPGIGLH